MADINNLKIGNSNPDALMLDKPYQPMANQFVSFDTIIDKNTAWDIDTDSGEWEINDDWDVTFVTPRIMRINKFKIDTWGIRQKHTKGSTILSSDFGKKLCVKVEGLSYVHQNIIKATANSEEVTGFVPAYCGTGGWIVKWYPGCNTSGNYVQGLVIQGIGCYTASYDGYGDSAYTMGRAPWEITSRDHFVADGIRPSGAMYGESRGMCIGLFGGVQNATAHLDNANGAYRIYDISDHPIYIYLDVPDSTAATDYSSVEVWDAYVGSTQVYHKDKTVENCWRKYKYITDKSGYNGIIGKSLCADSSFGDNIIVPTVTDLDNFFDTSDGKYPTFNIKAANSEFWSAIKEKLSTTGIVIHSADYGDFPGIFQNCNMTGIVTIKVLNTGVVAGERMFENCPVSEINFTYSVENSEKDNNRITSINTLFKSTPNLKTITSTKDLWARDMSGCFEFSGIEEIPGIIDYSSRAYNTTDTGADAWCSFTQYFCDGAASLKKIDRYRNATSREVDSNTIKMSTGNYSFNNCSSLTTIDPILDFEYVIPSNSPRVFGNCTSLTDVRIKNLNHGDWHFDNSYINDEQAQHGNLTSLDKDSIEYLFANLKDLTTRNPDLVYSGGSPSDSDWNGNQYAANPSVSSANLYCPSTWDTYITSEMISAANAKGWTIYVGNVEVQSS